MKINSSVVVFGLIILPQTIYSIIPSYFNFFYLTFITLAYILFIALNVKYLTKYIYPGPFVLTLLFIFLGLVNCVVHQKFSYFNILAPIIAYVGYVYIIKNGLNINYFIYTIIILYIYYFFIYYSILPDLFFRPNFDEDEAVFDNSSSNAIPISLNVTLFFYLIFNYLYKSKHGAKILIFSIINLIAVIIQQSRGGLIVSILLVLISFFEVSKKYFFLTLLVFSIFLLYFISNNLSQLNEYFDIIGDLNGLSALNDDVRGIAQAEFFNKLSNFNLFFGYPPNTIYVIWASTEIKYTYNVFLDVWNKYTVFMTVGLLILVLQRFVFFKSYKFPIYYLLPFLFYCMIESLFFPNFWDAIVYLIIFFPKNESPSNLECRLN